MDGKHGDDPKVGLTGKYWSMVESGYIIQMLADLSSNRSEKSDFIAGFYSTGQLRRLH